MNCFKTQWSLVALSLHPLLLGILITNLIQNGQAQKHYDK